MKKYRNFRIEQIKKIFASYNFGFVFIVDGWQVNVEIFGEIRQTEYSLFLIRIMQSVF